MPLRNAAERASLGYGSGVRNVQLVTLPRQAIGLADRMSKARAELLENLLQAAWLQTLLSAVGLNTGTQLLIASAVARLEPALTLAFLPSLVKPTVGTPCRAFT